MQYYCQLNCLIISLKPFCSCLLFISPRDKEVRGVILMDKDFTFTHGRKQTGVRNGLLVQNQSRYPEKVQKLILKNCEPINFVGFFVSWQTTSFNLLDRKKNKVSRHIFLFCLCVCVCFLPFVLICSKIRIQKEQQSRILREKHLLHL